MGDGIPVEELDDEECPKVQSQTKSQALQEVETPLRCSYRAVRYNQLFDEKAFVYDKSRSHLNRSKLILRCLQYAMRRNRWDQGCSLNCWNFWCWPRWPAVCG